MILTKGYLKYLLERFSKCESLLTSVSGNEMKNIKAAVMNGNPEAIKWVKSALEIYEIDFKPELKELEKYLSSYISTSK
jgi:hypothetical protein